MGRSGAAVVGGGAADLEVQGTRAVADSPSAKRRATLAASSSVSDGTRPLYLPCTGLRYPCGMAPTMTLRDSRARAERAAILRSIGRSWREVAGELGYRSIGAAQTAVERHELRNGPEPVETSRRSLITSARITHSILFDRFAAAIDREDDETAALLNRELVRNRDQLAKLTGAYAPENINVNVQTTPAAIIAEARERLLAVVDAEVVEPSELTR